ncbi:class A beta-lactamase [Hydrogenovibrio sp. JE_KL2]|uniref:class A beta-lactamase n=1 Tax=Hydrogenovibrio sp. JE_KL2 TaxID=2651188 RepID=UPI001561F382|nr:class A beta-lactamase [Hydrogenovibrio sp. JE_KL2]
MKVLQTVKTTIVSSFFTLSLWLFVAPAYADSLKSAQANFKQQISELESTFGGRLGVAVWDASSGFQLQYRGNERFALCSTFKFLLAASVLAKVDAKEESLSRVVTYSTSDLLNYAPITRKNLHNGEGEMTVSQLLAAALQHSDNTAANLLFEPVRGPQGLTTFMRSIGDRETRVDRIEPHLNTNIPGDERDTTTPNAMLKSMKKILLGHVLSEASKNQLTQWMLNNTTGANKLRAGIPTYWPIGDKTGSGNNGAMNDIAIMWPDADDPILVAVYYTGSKEPFETRNHVLEQVGRIISDQFSPH